MSNRAAPADPRSIVEQIFVLHGGSPASMKLLTDKAGFFPGRREKDKVWDAKDDSKQ
jgi:hypothetical protein